MISRAVSVLFFKVKATGMMRPMLQSAAFIFKAGETVMKGRHFQELCLHAVPPPQSSEGAQPWSDSGGRGVSCAVQTTMLVPRKLLIEFI